MLSFSRDLHFAILQFYNFTFSVVVATEQVACGSREGRKMRLRPIVPRGILSAHNATITYRETYNVRI